MRKLIAISIFIIMCSTVLLSGCTDMDSVMSLSTEDIPPIIMLMKRKDSLVVIKADRDLSWSNVEIKSGDCILPSGPIEAGDYITQCSGNLILRWIPSNSVMGEWAFS